MVGLGRVSQPSSRAGAAKRCCRVFGAGNGLGKACDSDALHLEVGQHGDLATQLCHGGCHSECYKGLWSEGGLLQAVGCSLPQPVLQWMWGQGAHGRTWPVGGAMRAGVPRCVVRGWRVAGA